VSDTKLVSNLMLERYRLGEVTEEERKLVEEKLETDKNLNARYEALDQSDQELLSRYPENLFVKKINATGGRSIDSVNRGRLKIFTKRRVIALCAAAMLLFILFPSVNSTRSRSSAPYINTDLLLTAPDRLKGAEIRPELFIFLKDGRSSEGQKLPDRTILREGSTVQLAYLVPPGNDHYGVIFSIDGNSIVTLHFPYRYGETTALSGGRQTLLNRSYILDDAPDFEVFFMVTSRSPLNTESILSGARAMARNPAIAHKRGNILVEGRAAFTGCVIETITILKQERR